MRIWFNKTFSTIQAVFSNLRQPSPAGEVTLICTHTYPTASAFQASDEAYLEPTDLQGEAYLDWCVAFCQTHKIDLFWPGKEAALISLHHAVFQAVGTRVVSVADHATLTLLHNKAHFYTDVPPAVAQTMDFRVANDINSFEQAIADLSPLHARLCIKPAVSVFGLGFRILDTERPSIVHVLKGVEYQLPLAEVRQGMKSAPQFDTLLVMEHLAGHEWSVDCAGKNGELLCAVQRKKSQLIGHGQTIDNNPDIADMVSRLTAHYRLNGLFNIQFKAGAHGVRLLEINPRPSGGFGMACLAGANLAQIALQAIQGKTIAQPTIHYGLRTTEVNTPIVLQDWAG